MSIPDLIFYGVALVTALTAAYAVFSPNIVRAVFSLLGTFFGVAIIYGMLAADYVAVVQLMVYVGGILVLLLFAVMLTSRIEQVSRSNRSTGWGIGLLLGVGAGVVLTGLAFATPWRQLSSTPPAQPTVEAIGEALMGSALLPFALASLVLLASVVGAVTLARKHKVGA